PRLRRGEHADYGARALVASEDRLSDPVVMSATVFPTSGAAISETFREARVEELLGKRLRDADGRSVGRIEELIAERQGTDLIVVEIHLGRGALLERFGELSPQLRTYGFSPSHR